MQSGQCGKGTYKHLRTGLKDGYKRIKPDTYIGSNVKKLSNKRMPRRNANHDNVTKERAQVWNIVHGRMRHERAYTEQYFGVRVPTRLRSGVMSLHYLSMPPLVTEQKKQKPNFMLPQFSVKEVTIAVRKSSQALKIQGAKARNKAFSYLIDHARECAKADDFYAQSVEVGNIDPKKYTKTQFWMDCGFTEVQIKVNKYHNLLIRAGRIDDARLLQFLSWVDEDVKRECGLMSLLAWNKKFSEAIADGATEEEAAEAAEGKYDAQTIITFIAKMPEIKEGAERNIAFRVDSNQTKHYKGTIEELEEAYSLLGVMIAQYKSEQV